MKGIKSLAKIRIFKDFSEEEIKLIAALCKERTFKQGEVIIEEDKPGEALYILESGRARVVKIEGEMERSIAEVGPGECVGEMSMIDGMMTFARVIAEEPTECLVLTREDFSLMLAGNDKLHIKALQAVTRILVSRLRRTSEDLMVWKLDFSEEF